MELDLPSEIIHEILLHVRDGSSDANIPLKDLRVAFVCRAFYRDFAPLVAMRQSNLINTEIEERRLKIFDTRGVSLWKAPIDLGKSGRAGRHVAPAQVYYRVKTFEATDAIWSLHSFLSRSGSAKQLSRFKLTLETVPYSLEQSWQHGARAEWRRALLKLLELVLSQEGLVFEFDFVGLKGSSNLVYPPAQSLVEGLSRESLKDNTRPKVRLSSLVLSSSISAFTPIGLSYLEFICFTSYSSVTHLHLDFSPWEDSSTGQREGILRHLKFEHLSYLSIPDLGMPPVVLVAIVEQNPTLTSLSINRYPTYFIPNPPWVPQLIRGDKIPPSPSSQVYLPSIRNLTCHPRILLALFQTSFAFPNLDTLTVCGYSSFTGSYCVMHQITAILSYLGQDKKPDSSPQPKLTLKIDLPHQRGMGLKNWFAAAGRLSASEYIDIKGASVVKALKGFTSSSKASSESETATPSESPARSTWRSKTYVPMSLALALRRLHNLESLTLIAQKFPVYDPEPGGRALCYALDVPPASVAKFIAALPAVKEVALHSVFHDLNMERGGGSDGLVDIRREIGKVWRMSTTVEKVTIFDYGHGELAERTEVLVRQV